MLVVDALRLQLFVRRVRDACLAFFVELLPRYQEFVVNPSAAQSDQRVPCSVRHLFKSKEFLEQAPADLQPLLDHFLQVGRSAARPARHWLAVGILCCDRLLHSLLTSLCPHS